VVGCTISSRGEVPGGRKPVIRYNDDDDINNYKYTPGNSSVTASAGNKIKPIYHGEIAETATSHFRNYRLKFQHGDWLTLLKFRVVFLSLSR
jgi:hypothetical protein